MFRKLVLGVSASALALGGLAVAAPPAGAAKIPVGNAVGSVSCTGGGKVKISPGLKNEDNAANNYSGYNGTPRWTVGPALTTAKLKLTCNGSTQNPAVRVTSGKVTATSQGTGPATCSSLLAGEPSESPFNIIISWKATGGSVNQTRISYSGFQAEGLGFQLPQSGGTATVTGSYAGNDSEAHAVLSELPDFARCDPKIKPGKNGKPDKVKAPKGMKKLSLASSGTLSITP